MRAFVTVACTLVLASSIQAARYTIIDLGALPGVGKSRARDINSFGVLVGSRTDSRGREHAFLYDGKMHDLGSLPEHPNTIATAVNDLGDVVGYSRPASGSADYHAFLWQKGNMTDLGTMPDYSHWTLATDINNSGQIAGTAYAKATKLIGRAFLYEDGTIHDLNVLTWSPPETSRELTGANAINNLGQLAGSAGGGASAFIWENKTITYLGGLPGRPSGTALGINDLGQVVGQCSGGTRRAFLYDGTTMHDLGVLPGDLQSVAYGVNCRGQVVGYSYKDSASKRAFLYEQGAMCDLNTLVDSAKGFMLLEARAINDRGQIVGSGTDADGEDHAFLLTPIAEPDSSLP